LRRGDVGDVILLEGFYKVHFNVDEAVGRSVMYAHAGRMLGGNSSFAHSGTYHETDAEIVAEIMTRRHHLDPGYLPLAGTDEATLALRGRAEGDLVHFEGTLKELPGSVFRASMTPIDEEMAPAAGVVGEGGIVNGLYSIRIRMLDGLDADLTGVMLLKDGRILGGDAFFYYLGGYSSANGRWKGQMLNQEHTPARAAYPIFGGHEVGIGFSGSCDHEGARLEATALAGRRSIRLTADLKLVRPA
jgi:hypothetical protein